MTTEDLPSPSPQKLLQRALHQHALRAGRRLGPSELARLERAFLACFCEVMCEVLWLYYVNLVVHLGGGFYTAATNINTPSSSSTPGSNGTGRNPCTSGDDMTLDALEDALAAA